MATANGVIPAFKITLNTLKIGTIVLNNVDATVIEGSSVITSYSIHYTKLYEKMHWYLLVVFSS